MQLTKLISLSLSAAVVLFSLNATAETINGRVIRVADGDTVTFLPNNGKKFQVRLNGIDAPEKKQPFSKVSKKSLASLCANGSASVETTKKDKYGRSIGNLYCNGVLTNEYQVSNGLAWVYRKYSKDARLLQLEANAKTNYLGLWNDPSPTPPWEWRKAKREGKKPSKTIRNEKRYFGGQISNFNCSKRAFCRNMTSCSEAKYYLNTCGANRLDRDHDGIPCESICGK